MAKLVHTMIRVLDADRSVAFYYDAFALTVLSRVDFDDFSLIYLGNDQSDVELELTVNHDQKSPYTLGEGYGHVAFVVDDLDAEHRRFQVAGYQPQKLIDMKHHGQLMARIFFVKDPDGYSIEVMQRLGRFR